MHKSQRAFYVIMSHKHIVPLAFLVLATVMQAQSVENTAPSASVRVHFDFGEHAIRADADSLLSTFYAEFEDQVLTQIRIVAHTDAIGSLSANVHLSERRAHAIRHWLLQRDVDSTLIELDWKGELDSVAMNQNDVGRQLNRRAEVQLFFARPMTTIAGTVQDSLGQGLDARIVVHGRDFRDSTRADTLGRFSMLVPDSTVLGLDIFHPGYLYTTEMFKSGTRRQHKLDFKPRPIERDVTFALHRFYFVGNQAVLLKQSEPELKRLLRFMEMNPTVAINIEGHVNFPNRPKVKTDSWEYGLSFRRAKMVYTFLVDSGIPKERLSFEAFGNWHMVFPKARTEAQQAKNRRVEIRITDY